MNVTVKGRIVRGLQAASGRSRLMRRGTIALQLPHFRAMVPGFDRFFDGTPHAATLNVEVPGRRIEVARPALRVPDVRWERNMVENFYLQPCSLRFSGRDYRGMVYIPDPATKPAGLPVGHVLEVMTRKVPFIRYGSPVSLTFDEAAVRLVPATFVMRRQGGRRRKAR